MRRPPFLLLTILLSLITAAPVLAQDADNDGVLDVDDLCPSEDASFFDGNADGCIDDFANARHIEFWRPENLPLEFWIHQNGAPGIGDGSDFTAIQQGFDTWTNVPGAQISMSYAGTTTQGAADGMDGINLVTFVDPEFQVLYGNAVLAVGVTTSFTVPTNFNGTDVLPGEIVDADMLFNPNRQYSTDTAGVGPDLRGVATHECGHLLGLNHSSIPSATMFPALPSGTAARTLELDDQIMAFMAYPQAAAAANATVLEGSVSNGTLGVPLPGALIFVSSAPGGAILASQYTLPDGSFRVAGLPAGDVYVYATPLDGSSGSNGVVPGYINDIVDSTAVTVFLPEFWDSAESNVDDRAAKTAITLSAGSTTSGIDIIANQDLLPPNIADSSPTSGAGDVRNDAVILLEFDERLDFDSLAGRFHLNRTDIAGGVTGSLSLLSGDKVLVFSPSGPLAYDASYELTLDPGITDLFGNAIAAEITQGFSTQSAPPLSILSVSPTLMTAGVTAVVNGEGFDTDTPSNNIVHLGALSVPAISVTNTRLRFEVPANVPVESFDLSVSTSTETSNVLNASGFVSVEVARASPNGSLVLSGTPRSIAVLPDRSFAYVATSAGLSMIVVSPASFEFGALTEYPLGALTDLAVAPDASRVYAISGPDETLQVINSRYGTDINSPLPDFNNVLFTLPIESTPRGIAISPGGERAYIAVKNGIIQVWDILLSSDTYNRRIGEIHEDGVSWEGGLAVDPSGTRLLGISRQGTVYVYSTADGTKLGSAYTGPDPQDIAADPQGNLAYVTDASGQTAIFSLSSMSVTQTIQHTGSPRGIGLTPAGGLSYVANRNNDTLDAVELRGGELAFRTVVAELPIADDPVDVAVSPDGQQVYSISEGTNTFDISGIGFGPELFSITPRFAQPGDIVALYGQGFYDVDSTLTVITSGTGLFFGDDLVTPTSATQGYLFARVPDGYDGGPIRAANSGPVFVGLPDVQYSNPLFLKEPAPLPPAVQDSMGLASFLGQDTGFPWTDTSNGLLISPDGKLLLLQGNTEVEIVDIDQSSPTYFQHLGSLANEGLLVSGNAAFSPDGGRLFISNGQSRINIYDMRRNSPDFAQIIGDVYFYEGTLTQFTSSILRTTPDGRYLMVVNDYQLMYAWADPNESAYRDGALASNLNSTPKDMAVHPSGLYVYTISSDGGLLEVTSLDPFQPTEFSNVYTGSATAAGAEYQRLAFSPDGSRCFISTRVGGLGGTYELDVLDTSSPANPVHLRSYEISQGSPGEEVYISMHPSGDRVLVTIVGQLAQILDVSKSYGPQVATVPDPVSFLQSVNEGVAMVPPAHCFSPDGTRLFIGQWADSGVNMLELRKAGQLEVISGANQVGVAGETLPAPVRVRVTQLGTPVPYSSVEVKVVGGQGLLGNGQSFQLLTTDANGEATLNWTLGPDPVAQGSPGYNLLQLFSVPASGSQGALQLVGASSVEDPGTLPLALAGVVPNDGSASVSVTTTLQATFSRPVDPLSVDGSQIQLLEAGAPVAGRIGFSQLGQKVSFVPIATLDYSTDYEFIVGTSIQDSDGQSLAAPDTTRFTTQAPPPLVVSSLSPPSGAVGTQVTISGTGFDPVASQNVIRLGSKVVPAIGGDVNYLRFQVPLGAGTGTVTVEANSQNSGGKLFTVLLPTTEPVDEIAASVDLGSSPQALAVTPDGMRAYSVSTETDQVIPVDVSGLSSGSPIAVGDAPVAIAIDPEGISAYVVNYGSGTVSVIELATDTVVATIPVGNNPAEIAISPDGDQIYVVSSVDQEVDVIDGDETSATYRSVLTSLKTGSSTKSVAVSPDGTRLFLGTNDGYISIDLTPGSFGVLTSLKGTGGTRSVAVSPDGGLLFLLTELGDIVVVDIGSGGEDTVLATLSGSGSTRSVAVSPDGGLLYLTQEDSDEIIVYSIEVIGSVSVVESSGSLGPTQVTLVLVNSFFAGDNPSFVVFDPSGSGLAFVGNAGDGTLSLLQSAPLPPAEIDLAMELTPRTLNLDSNGNYVTARIEFPFGFLAQDVDLSTVRLQDVVPPVQGKTSYEDADLDGLGELVMKFDRAAFQQVMPVGDRVAAWVTGIVQPNSVYFTARDTIRTLRPSVTHPKGGEFLNPGQQIVISWENGNVSAAATVDVHWSADGGENWMPIVQSVPNQEQISWTVPAVYTLEGRVLVTFYDDAGEDIGMGISPGEFAVQAAIPVAMQSMRVVAENGDGLLDWTAVVPPTTRGFHVLRGDQAEGPFARLTDRPVTAQNSSEEGRYEYRDTEVFGNHDYYYMLQEETTQGEGALFGPFPLSYTVANSLEQNFPNSFNPRTSIRFSIAREGRTRLVVYNVAGRRVKTLVDGVLKPDVYTVQWNGDDNTGSSVSSGIYLYRLETVGFTATKKMSLVR